MLPPHNNVVQQITMIDEVISNIRSSFVASGMTKRELARQAGLHENTVLKLEHAAWNPSSKTIRALETVLRKPSTRAKRTSSR